LKEITYSSTLNPHSGCKGLVAAKSFTFLRRNYDCGDVLTVGQVASSKSNSKENVILPKIARPRPDVRQKKDQALRTNALGDVIFVPFIYVFKPSILRNELPASIIYFLLVGLMHTAILFALIAFRACKYYLKPAESSRFHFASQLVLSVSPALQGFEQPCKSKVTLELKLKVFATLAK